MAGEKIILGSDGKIEVPDNPVIPCIEGDGPGPDIWRAAVAVFDAADRTRRVYTINSFGPLLVLLGDFERAAQLYELSLQILEEHFEPDHLELAKTLYGLAALHRQQGRDDLAEPLLERALAIRRAKLPPDHPDLTEILIELDQLRRDPASTPRGDGR